MKLFLWLPVLLLLFCGCAAQDKEFTFPENTAIAGVDVSGDTIEQADAALAAWPETYRIRVLMDGAETFLTAADLNLTYHAPTDWETAPDLTPEQVYSVTVPEDILDRLNGLDDTRKDGAELATMGYSETEGAFVVIPGKTWTYHDYAPTYDKLAEAVKALAPEVRLHSVLVTVPGQTAEDTDLPGVNTANRWLNASVTLNFPNGSVTVGKDAILPWISIGEDHLTPALDLDAISAYGHTLAQQYTVPATDARVFTTVSGQTITLQYGSDGYTADGDSLADELIQAIQQGLTQDYTVQISETEPAGTIVEDFGGNYVEVDIGNQMVYCYQNGSLVISSPCVTGCVADGCGTPTGLYYFYDFDRDTVLTGPTWEDWVDCWMGFYGGYGLHDANWRTEFGGDIYLENGSHGCVNLPPDVAPVIYNAIDYGTAIILY